MKKHLLSILAAGFAGVCLAACGGSNAPADDSGAQGIETATPEPEGESADSDATASREEALPPPPSSAAGSVDWPETETRVRIAASLGDIVVELYRDAAPQTVANFLQYAEDGHYDRTIFHRVVAGFVIQGGGYNQYFSERPTRDPVPYEGGNGLGNYRSTLAMARTSDPNSAAAQFYINLKDNTALNHIENDLGVRPGYTVFGRVIEGMAVADQIGATPTADGGPFPAEVPVSPILIERIDLIQKP